MHVRGAQMQVHGSVPKIKLIQDWQRCSNVSVDKILLENDGPDWFIRYLIHNSIPFAFVISYFKCMILLSDNSSKLMINNICYAGLILKITFVILTRPNKRSNLKKSIK